MIAYTTIGTADIDKAKAFYLAVMEDMGVTVVMDLGRLAALGHSQWRRYAGGVHSLQ